MQQVILNGIERGVKRHWRFAKNLFEIRPEYLLTVSVADALTNGACGVDGLDLTIGLEVPTKAVSFNLLSNALGLRAYFKAQRHKCVRKGRVDIFVEHEKNCWIIEIKCFDPSVAGISNDLLRLADFLSVNDWHNNCRGAYLAFPTRTDEKARVDALVQETLGSCGAIEHAVHALRIETGEDPDDGIPAYYANCIELQCTKSFDSQQ